MSTYRALFDNKKLVSVARTEQDTPSNDTFLEETTGETIWATIEAKNDAEAQEKAEHLETELQTRQAKETIRQKENSQ
ncbi:MAG: hypothetical protein M3R72_01060 [Bacteroidota bacterium]|nr:hypothetical protein [Bacteroidota bacterium]